jgi:acyl carrier protein
MTAARISPAAIAVQPVIDHRAGTAGTTVGEPMQHLQEVRNIVAEVLSLGDRADSLNQHSPLLGALPELDSMSVVNLIAALETHFDFVVHDDEISASSFATLGALAEFVEGKLAA